MAMIPDEAVMYAGSITPAAFRLYAFYCMCRNKKSGGFTIPRARVLASLPDMKRTTYFVAKKELIEKGWIAVKGNFIRPLLGFESSENRTIQDRKSSGNGTVKNHDSSENGTDSSEIGTHSSENGTAYIRNIPAPLPAPLPEMDPAEDVFTFWKETFGKGAGAKFIKKRRDAVKKRLDEGYTLDELRDAILGCSITPWNMGENPRGGEFVDLELICRDGIQVERFRDRWVENQSTQSPGKKSFCDRCRDLRGFYYVGDEVCECDCGDAGRLLSGKNGSQ